MASRPPLVIGADGRAQNRQSGDTVNLVAADLPVMVASGSGHAAGAVPDPGATAGTGRFLREDGTFRRPRNAVYYSLYGGF